MTKRLAISVRMELVAIPIRTPRCSRPSAASRCWRSRRIASMSMPIQLLIQKRIVRVEGYRVTPKPEASGDLDAMPLPSDAASLSRGAEPVQRHAGGVLPAKNASIHRRHAEGPRRLARKRNQPWEPVGVGARLRATRQMMPAERTRAPRISWEKGCRPLSSRQMNQQNDKTIKRTPDKKRQKKTKRQKDKVTIQAPCP